MLRTFAEEAAPSIASLFNLSLSLGKLPNDWKCSNVVPIPKESNKSDVRFYRAAACHITGGLASLNFDATELQIF